MADRQPLVIVGAGGHGKVVLDIAAASQWQVRGFIDGNRAAGEPILNNAVLGDESLLDDAEFLRCHALVVAIGHQQARRRLSLKILQAGGNLATLRHPASVVSPFATIGDGTVLAAGSIVNPSATVGRFCILNTGCTIDHDVQLDDGVQICPGANLAGGVICGADVFVGTGAVVIPRVRIGRDAVVGAGAVVIGDVPPGITVVGNPARPGRRGSA